LRSNGPGGVIHANPVFDKVPKLFRLLHKEAHFGLGRHIGHVVIDLVSPAAAEVEVGRECVNGGPHRNLQRLKRDLMMSQPDDAVSFAGDHDLGELQDCIVGSCEAAVVGEGAEFGVLQVPLNDGPQIVDLLGPGDMNPYPLRVQQVLPSHLPRRK